MREQKLVGKNLKPRYILSCPYVFIYLVYLRNLTSVPTFLTNSVFVYYAHDRIEIKSKN